jgi:hypothetical protein
LCIEIELYNYHSNCFFIWHESYLGKRWLVLAKTPKQETNFQKRNLALYTFVWKNLNA